MEAVIGGGWRQEQRSWGGMCWMELRADDSGTKKKKVVRVGESLDEKTGSPNLSEISTWDGKAQKLIHSFYFDEKLRILHKEQIKVWQPMWLVSRNVRVHIWPCFSNSFFFSGFSRIFCNYVGRFGVYNHWNMVWNRNSDSMFLPSVSVWWGETPNRLG